MLQESFPEPLALDMRSPTLFLKLLDEVQVSCRDKCVEVGTHLGEFRRRLPMGDIE